MAEVGPLLDRVPDLEAIDPEKCYVGWDILLFSDTDINAVKDVLIFLEYDPGCVLSIDQMKKAGT